MNGHSSKRQLAWVVYENERKALSKKIKEPDDNPVLLVHSHVYWVSQLFIALLYHNKIILYNFITYFLFMIFYFKLLYASHC